LGVTGEGNQQPAHLSWKHGGADGRGREVVGDRGRGRSSSHRQRGRCGDVGQASRGTSTMHRGGDERATMATPSPGPRR
jgi:hypothetical protein